MMRSGYGPRISTLMRTAEPSFCPWLTSQKGQNRVPKHKADVIKANYTQEVFAYGFTLTDRFNTVLNLDPDEI